MKTQKALSVFLALLMLLSVCAGGASAMVIERPEGFDAFARLHIPQHLHISVEEIDKIAGFVYGTATWDDDELVSEGEFYPGVQVNGGWFLPKCSPFLTIVKRGTGGGWMAPAKEQEIDPYDQFYDAEDGVCTKQFVIKLLGDDEEIETWDNGLAESNGVKLGSQLRFTMSALVELDGYFGETPECDPVEFTLTEDAVGKIFTANGVLDPFAEDKAAFETYKNDKAAALDALKQDGDSAVCQKLIADAKAEITAIAFDESKSLDENKAIVDAKVNAVTAKLTADLEAQRASEKPEEQKPAETDKEENETKAPEKCKWCGEDHEGFFGKIVGFFHSVLYFFAHLFGLK